MKTMLSVDGKKIIRISNEKASKLYEEGFRFISKSEWKEKVRDVNKPEPTKEEPTEKKNNKMSRATKRHLKNSSK
jgi:hypothetical protein